MELITLITPIAYYNYVIFNFIIRLSITTIAGGLIGTPGFVGFGSSAPGISIAGGTINLTNPAGTLTNFAFSMSRNGIITDISAFLAQHWLYH